MSATAFNPLMDSWLAAPDPGPPPTGSDGGATRGADMGPTPQGNAAAADLVGRPPLTGTHNAPLHVALLGLVALGVIILLRRAGFRFAVVGRVSAGGG